MSVHHSRLKRAHHRLGQTALLAGASMMTLVIALAGQADARSLGGIGSAASTSAASFAAAAVQAAAQQAAQTASQAMIRASAGLQNMRSIQSAARAAALAAGAAVPNGLAPGGLVVAPGVNTDPTLWRGAMLPSETASGGRTQVEIKQTEAKAILTWDKFNIGRETDLYFNQTAGGPDKANWVALNRVIDPSLAPSRILGTIKADGQVYVINKNGIVFGGSSQVNVHTFVASSLSLSNEQFLAGINVGLSIKEPTGGGSDWGIPTFGDSTTATSAALVGSYATAPGDVVVERGAVIESQSGGKAMLFAPHVTNAGSIRTPGGQTLLAAGENVWITDVQLRDPSSSLRGLDVAASSPTAALLRYNDVAGQIGGWWPDPTIAAVLQQMDVRAAAVGYSVTNTGSIEAARGNITVVAREIAQNGVMLASTALNNQDGSIFLRAWSQGFKSYGADMSGMMYWWSSGTVSLGANSLTTVIPNLTDTSTIELSNVAARYRAGTIDLRGNLINVQSGATVVAPSGTITVVASNIPTTSSSIGSSSFDKVDDGSRIYIDSDALLSVGGLRDVLLAMESNTVMAELRINELRDSVLYLDSWLRGATVYVDKRDNGTFTDGPMAGVQWFRDAAGNYLTGRWEGTSLADVSGWIGTRATTLAELSTVGGKILLKAGGETIIRAGAVLDVSGGSVRYADGYITTTRLLGANGRLYDIGDATPDQMYVGLAGSFTRHHQRINVTETWHSVLDRSAGTHFEHGYTEGRNAGSIVIYNAAGLVMEGELDGHVIAGERQAAGGKSAIAGSLQLGDGSDPGKNWLSSNVVISHATPMLDDAFTVDSDLPLRFYDPAGSNDPDREPAYRAKTTYLDDGMLNRSGLGKFEIYYNKTFKVEESARVELSSGAALNVYQNMSPNTATLTNAKIDGSIRIAGGTINIKAGNAIDIGAKAVLDVSGLWLNEFSSGPPREAPRINGGSVTLQIDANARASGIIGEVTIASGATIDVSGGGWLRNSGGKPKLQVGDAGAIILTNVTGNSLADVNLRGYAAGSGGSLDIAVLRDVQIGGVAPADPTTFYLQDTLFGDRGFRSLAIATQGNATVPADVTVTQLPQNVDLTGINLASFASGTKLTDIGRVRVLDLQDRVALKPASLNITAFKTLKVSAGVTLATDVKGSIILSHGSDSSGSPKTGNAMIEGTIIAPAGSVTVDAKDVTMAAAARILAKGQAVIYTDPATGSRMGNVLDGGSVSLSGALTLDPSAVIDVSGTSGVIDDPERGRGGNATLLLASNGGQITLTGGKTAGSKVDAILIGNAGGSGASGGALRIGEAGISAGAQNPLTGLYIGYFQLVGTGGKYSYDAASGTYYANASSGTYNFVGGTSSGTASTVIDLDIYDEFGTTAYRLSSTMKTAVNSLGSLTSAPMRLVSGLAADAPALDPQAPWVVNPAIDQKAVTLLNKYFYVATRSGTTYTPGAKINIKGAQPTGTDVSANVINAGGFGSVGLPSMIVGDGVILNLQNASVSIGRVLAASPTSSAEIHAGYLSLAGTILSVNEAGTGTLLLDADLIDITSGVIRGYGNTRLVAGEIRMDAPSPGVTSVFDVGGTLTLQAGQIYPSTMTTAVIKASDRIVVLPNGSSSAPPLSAGGNLTLSSSVIDIYGNVRVPFGSLTLSATTSITLGAGSNVSVSGDGLTVPYGVLFNGQDWAVSVPGNPLPVAITALPEKKLVLNAPSVNMAAGSTVDIRGGGDLRASEFVVGSGGSHDILAMKGVYAILPSSSSTTTPYGSTVAVGSRIWLAGGNGLSAGWYTLLPPQYALLPGAFAIQMVAGSTGKAVNAPVKMLDGTLLMSGRLGNSFDGSSEQLASNWRVMSGSVIRSYSEYNEASANDFFSSETYRLTQYRQTGLDVLTPRMPMDGGAVVFKASSELALDGQLLSQGANGGRAGIVDIAATNIAVVGAGQDRSGLAGYLIIDSSRLSSFGAASLLLGGVRTATNLGIFVEVEAGSIVIRNDAGSALTGPEIILAATNSVTISSGSVLRAEGVATGGSGDLTIVPQVAAVWNDNGTPTNAADDYMVSPARDFGALIRLSTGPVVNVQRTNVDGTASGTVDIGAGAVIAGGNALLIDATRNTMLANSAQVSAVDITLSGSRIGFGGGSSGLVFDAAGLARFNMAQNLTLRSYSSIDFYTGIDFGSAGLRSVTLDATGMVGYSAGTTTVTGKTVTLRNTGGSFVDPQVTAQGALAINAERIVLGAGMKTLRGFNTMTLAAANGIAGQGSGTLDASGNLSLVAPLLTGENGANQSIVATGVLTVASNGDAAERDAESLGTRWALTGASIDFGGRIDAIGGTVSLTATSGNVNLLGGAMIDVGGIGKVFNDMTAYANAGTIELTSVGGNIVTQAGSTLNLSAVAGGGDAGKLSAIASGGGTVALNGAIDAHATAGKGGSFVLDIGALPDFGSFSQRLEAAGFTRSRSFRVRNGDVVIDGVTRVENFNLSTDAGKVTITGTIDASAAYGGNIAIIAGNGLTMMSTASLAARSTTALGSGRVTLDASGGALDVRGGVIDVSGGQGGKVRFRALQNAAHNDVAVAKLQVGIVGSRSSVLEGVAVYESTDGTVDSQWAGAVADAATFMTATLGIAATIASGIDVMAGVQIYSRGDLALNGSIDLANTFAGHEGSLTLRAAGNLSINGDISDGFSDATRNGALLAQNSWDLRLVAGADIDAADTLSVKPLAAIGAGQGSLIVGDATHGYQVRTGTGDVAVRAGRDVELAHYASVIYTAGRNDTTPYPDFVAPVDYHGASSQAQYGVLGGNLSIDANGGIKSILPADNSKNMLYTNWLKKAGEVDITGVFRDYYVTEYVNGVLTQRLVTANQTTWWVDYGAFTQGVGALGGGNINVQAGGDLDNLLVALPTTGRVSGGRLTVADKVLHVDNGGAMTVVAGGAVKAGNYYIARGSGTIDAGTFANGRTIYSTIVSGQTVLTPYDIAPVLALGDATLNVRTTGDMRLQTLLDPLMSFDVQGASEDRHFQTYLLGQTENSQLNLMSIGGDVILVNQARYLSQDVTSPGGWADAPSDVQFANMYAGNLYPAMTKIVALNGSISNLGQLSTLPGSRSGLTMLAANSIEIGNVLMSRATPNMLASPLLPVGGGGHTTQYYDQNGSSTDKFLALLRNDMDHYASYSASQDFNLHLRDIGNPDVLANAGDMEPSRIYALNGSIKYGKIISNEQTWLSAGGDIRDLSLNLRNLHATDVSWINAGNDYLNRSLFSMLNRTQEPGIVIQGPGAVLLSAGRDIYADRLSIWSIGNQFFDANNQPVAETSVKALPGFGASVDIIAGLNGKQPNYAAMSSAYLDPSQAAGMPGYLTTTVNGQILPLYLVDDVKLLSDGTTKLTRTGLVSFIKLTTGETLSPLDAWAKFQTLPTLTQQRVLRQIFMQELREAGRDQNKRDADDRPLNGGYARGYQANALLFPGDAWKGNLQSDNALIRTMSGGDINILAPGGGLQVAALNQQVEANYGLVTLGDGQINIAARENVVVNRSRILTFSGGDVTIWSTTGDIDAGKGAKTTRVPSAPVVKTDEDTVTRIQERPDITGSGIGTVVGFAGVQIGDLDMIAPVGTVDAGDAGIRVSGNFNVAAMIVLNADNIKVAGESKGVPKAQAPAIYLTAETKDKAAADAVKDSTQQTGNDRPSVIIVEVLGYGGGSGGDNERKEEERQRRSDMRGYDATSPYQVIGLGPLSESQIAALASEKRRQLDR